MSQYGFLYQLQWNTVPSVLRKGIEVPDQAMIVSIYDTENIIDDVSIPTIIQLLPDANPLVIKIINNDEDKFSPIRAKQAVIQFKSNSPQFQDSLTFADSPDNRWYVEVTADGQFVFKGFLMLTDSQQDHLPDPNIVKLTASDHLALLKDIPLSTFTSESLVGKYRIAELIAFCLHKTGIDSDIKVINNLRTGSGILLPAEVIFGEYTVDLIPEIRVAHVYGAFFYVGQIVNVTGTVSNNTTYTVVSITDDGSTTFITVAEPIPAGESSLTATLTDDASDGHFYDKVYIDALTFEASIGESIDSYTVLERILGEDCFLTQWKGYWYIMRVDEFDGNPIYPATFDSIGAFVGFDTPTDYSKSIGATETRRLADADALRRYDRPYGYIKEIFDFEYPKEIPCNTDYSRGDVSTDPDVQRTGYTSYELDCWTPYRLWGSARTTPNFKAAILRSFNNFGDEDTRFIMLTKPASATGSFEYIECLSIPVSTNDRFTWKFEAAAMQATSGDGVIRVCFIVLYGVDGKVYILRANISILWDQSGADEQTFWKVTDPELSLFRDGMTWSIYDDSDHPPKTDWVSFTMNAAPVPVEGELKIFLFAPNQQAGSYDDFDIKYQNLTFEYRPYIGGTYLKYTKFQHKVTRDPVGYFNARRERQVYIADSPKPIFKGSMFIYNGSRYVLTSRWYTAAPFALGPPPSVDYLHSYGYIQAYSVWNQFRNGNRILDSTVLGLGSMWSDALDKVSLTDSNPHVDNRYFMLISFEQNWKTALWSGVFIEDYRTDIGKIYTDDHEFQYLTN